MAIYCNGEECDESTMGADGFSDGLCDQCWRMKKLGITHIGSGELVRTIKKYDLDVIGYGKIGVYVQETLEPYNDFDDDWWLENGDKVWDGISDEQSEILHELVFAL